ncbi:lipoprotein [Aquabacterium sp. A3]|uniref:LPS translocon maturation chaperone LptM n=1 Tax=Aquabacterium sp. A3 TaxID=3132829 RepID=UPI00311A17BC
MGTAAALAVGLTTLSACGLKGPLYLPGPESAPAATPSAPAASAPLPQPSTAP